MQVAREVVDALMDEGLLAALERFNRALGSHSQYPYLGERKVLLPRLHVMADTERPLGRSPRGIPVGWTNLLASPQETDFYVR